MLTSMLSAQSHSGRSRNRPLPVRSRWWSAASTDWVAIRPQATSVTARAMMRDAG